MFEGAEFGWRSHLLRQCRILFVRSLKCLNRKVAFATLLFIEEVAKNISSRAARLGGHVVACSQFGRRDPRAFYLASALSALDDFSWLEGGREERNGDGVLDPVVAAYSRCVDRRESVA